MKYFSAGGSRNNSIPSETGIRTIKSARNAIEKKYQSQKSFQYHVSFAISRPNRELSEEFGIDVVIVRLDDGMLSGVSLDGVALPGGRDSSEEKYASVKVFTN
jgi:hypothetical protein